MHSPEWYEKRDICEFLDSIGAWYFKPYIAGYGGSGVPDIVGGWRGYFFVIEVKREGKAPSKLQEKRINQVQAAGGIALWGTATRVIPLFKEMIELLDTK